MAQSELTMIIDYNNFVMRSLFTCQFMDPDVKINNFNTQSEIDTLIRKITMDICYIVRLFTPKRIILSCDSKSPWRKELYKDIDGMEYKGNREKDSDKNWDNIFAATDELREIFKKHGFIVTYLDNTEADDITTMWKEYAFDHNSDVVLVSSDMDWVQLVGMGDKGNVCVCINPIANNKGRKRLYISPAVNKWLNEEDKPDIFFSNYNRNKKTIREIQLLDPKISFELIDPERILMNKIMAGDVSDNVPSFFHYYRNGRRQNVTELKAKHVFESLNINSVNDLVEANNKMMLKDVLEKEMKQDIDVDFKERMDRQRKLVELKSSMFPKKIVDNFVAKAVPEYDTFCENTSGIKMDDILRDTRYIKKESQYGKLNSVFDDISSLSKHSTNSKALFE